MSVPEGINKFGFELLQQILNKIDFTSEEPITKNVLISPLSIALSLSMLIEGADGDTKKQLLDALHFPENYLTELKATVDQLLNFLNASNSIWVHQSFKLAEQYADIIKQNFSNFEAKNINFAEPQAATEVNDWIKEKTEGLIKNAVNPSPDTSLLLVNTLVFKGAWLTEFDPKYTQRLPFKGFNFKSTPSFMINMKAKFKFHNGPNFKALELPYSSHSKKIAKQKKFADDDYDSGATSMFLILPKPPVAPNWRKICNAEFLTNFVQQIVPGMMRKDVVVYIPKLRYSEEYSLKDHLELMGVEDMWKPGSANFSKITASSSGLFATSAIHKTYIEVDEVGTKAAAATAFDMGYGGVDDEPDPEEFKAEHPFIYFIYHHATEQVLFIGVVLSPTISPLS